MNRRFILLLAGLGMCTASCDLINPAEPVPAYVTVESFDVQPAAIYGSGANKISDVYVLVGSVSLGAYELPATFPVIETGDKQLVLSPGIVVNGISNARGIYPFYENHFESITLVPGEVTVIKPVIGYRDVTVGWLEDFEATSGFSLEATTSSQVALTGFPANDPEIFEGINSGKVVVTSPNSLFDLVSSDDFNLSANSSIFLEINYKCNNAFTIGVEADNGSTQQRNAVLTVNPKESWNKLYVDLQPGVAASSTAFDYKVYFTGTRDGSLTEAYFYFDNLKLLHD